MDLSKLRSSKGKEERGFLKKNITRAKYWLLPPTTERRKERISQYKDFGIFLGAILVVALCEDKIKNFLEIENLDMQKMAAQGAF